MAAREVVDVRAREAVDLVRVRVGRVADPEPVGAHIRPHPPLEHLQVPGRDHRARADARVQPHEVLRVERVPVAQVREPVQLAHHHRVVQVVVRLRRVPQPAHLVLRRPPHTAQRPTPSEALYARDSLAVPSKGASEKEDVPPTSGSPGCAAPRRTSGSRAATRRPPRIGLAASSALRTARGSHTCSGPRGGRWA